ncbi:carbohydrate esterase family 5 protein [Hypholoma sublateritium FD-334 SS-4]|uniref:Cutinase n=1 Tax=Hypholoma sublateritium (strain FD-334 SS-4) TaxID=945553 RepID=A0A0D2NUY3_HYPSF|nr:carbohydrate esterase family 5 protein [Hypholoma sublateritium FD-334 SS-4]
MFKKVIFLSFVALAAAAPSPRAPCADVTVIFARGTSELPPIGAIVGPPLEAALISALGSKTLNFVGVNYAASIAGFLVGGDPLGAATMASDVALAIGACPSTDLVMSGYSQGGQLVHLAAAQLSPAVQEKIKAIVIFGDPDNGKVFPGNLNAVEKTFCAVGDDICLGGDLVLPAHLSYGVDTLPPPALLFPSSEQECERHWYNGSD